MTQVLSRISEHRMCPYYDYETFFSESEIVEILLVGGTSPRQMSVTPGYSPNK